MGPRCLFPPPPPRPAGRFGAGGGPPPGPAGGLGGGGGQGGIRPRRRNRPASPPVTSDSPVPRSRSFADTSLVHRLIGDSAYSDHAPSERVATGTERRNMTEVRPD